MTGKSVKPHASDMINYAVGIGYNYSFECHGDEGESHIFYRDFKYCRTGIVVYTDKEGSIRAHGTVRLINKTILCYYYREFDKFSPDIIKCIVRYFQEKNQELHLFIERSISNDYKNHAN